MLPIPSKLLQQGHEISLRAAQIKLEEKQNYSFNKDLKS